MTKKKKTPKEYGYTSISLHEKVLLPAREIVNERESMYTSITDFVREAVREKVRRERVE
jgi:hypothetical protein